MMSLEAQIDRPSTRKLRKMRRETPKAYERAVRIACSNARRHLVAAIKAGGGKNGLPAFVSKNWLTIALEGKGKWYGKLGQSQVIKSWRESGVQHVGWITPVKDFVGNLQQAEYRRFTDAQKHFIHKKGIADVPGFYDRPARLVIDPFREYLVNGEKIAYWIAAAAEKILAGKMGLKGTNSQTMAKARSKGYAQAQGREG